MTVDNGEAFSRDALVAQLESMGQRVKGSSVTCPWHEDRTPSAGVFQDDAGHWRIKCHTCDRTDDVYGLRDEKPSNVEGVKVKVSRIERKPPSQVVLKDKKAVKEYCEHTGPVTNWYKYGTPESPCLVVARVMPRDGGKKTFRQFSPQPDGTYVVGKVAGLTPPVYLHHQVAFCDTVLVVEGEKCADAAWSLGIPATTSLMGGGNARHTDWTALAGKTIVLWPDNDPTGHAYMEEVMGILSNLECVIKLIDPSSIGVPAKGDIADMVASGVTKDDVQTLMDEAVGVGESGLDEFLQWQKDVLAGKWECLPWPQRYLGSLSRAALPGSVTMLCSDPGAGKSFLMLQLLRFWTKADKRVNLIMFEDGKKEHLARLLAQLTENGDHTDSDWMKANPEQVAADTAEHVAELAILDRKLLVEKDDEWSGEDVLAWAEAKGKLGARVLILDPITALKPAKEPWIQDFKVCMGLKRVAKKYQLSVIVTTHPRNGVKEPSMTGMNGGVAWSRFSHSVLWLTSYSTPWEVRLINGNTTTVNRAIHILKCRYGRGAGSIIGINFGKSVKHEEAGIIAPDTGEHEAPPRADPDEMEIRRSKMTSTPSEKENLF